MFDNPFIKQATDYKRDLNYVKNYIEDATLYLVKMTGRPEDECRQYITSEVMKKAAAKQCLWTTRQQNGDRIMEEGTIIDYIHHIAENDLLCSPTLAVYQRPEVKRSMLATYIDENVKLRASYKKKKFTCSMAGDVLGTKTNDLLQSSMKIKNNSLSGAHSSPYTPLFNKSSHSTLTSTCRSATSYANANNERFLFGNRHYWSPSIAIANIVSVVRNTDYKQLQECLSHYGLRCPTADEVKTVVRSSVEPYWRDWTKWPMVESTIDALNEIERAAFLFTSDMRSLHMCNPEFVETFLKRLAAKVNGPIENPDQYIEAMDSDLTAYIGIICAEELRGKTIAITKENSPEAYMTIAATVKNSMEVISEYGLMIRTLWITDNMPSSMANVPTMLRKGVVVSDTDSTIFTVQDWVAICCGEVCFTQEANAIAAAVTYLITQNTIHLLANLSTSLGVEKAKLNVIAMKNEFTMPVFINTSSAKHYFTYVAAQEGNVYDKFHLDVKGVNLKNSKLPPSIKRRLEGFQRLVMDTLMQKGEINLLEMLQYVANIEHEIINSVYRGEMTYMTSAQVKDPSSYANPASSPYVYYSFWESIFANKYGKAPPPSYQAAKVSLSVEKRAAFNAWMETLKVEYPETALSLQAWMSEQGRTSLTYCLLPVECLAGGTGIPVELRAAIDIRGIVYTLMTGYYLILESLGWYCVDPNNIRLVSDFIDMEDPDAA